MHVVVGLTPEQTGAAADMEMEQNHELAAAGGAAGAGTSLGAGAGGGAGAGAGAGGSSGAAAGAGDGDVPVWLTRFVGFSGLQFGLRQLVRINGSVLEPALNFEAATGLGGADARVAFSALVEGAKVADERAAQKNSDFAAVFSVTFVEAYNTHKSSDCQMDCLDAVTKVTKAASKLGEAPGGKAFAAPEEGELGFVVQ